MERLSILFDLDGTLTNNKEGIIRCVQFAMERLGVPLDRSDNLEWVIGPPLQASLARLLGPERKHQTQEALEIYRERYLEKGMFENRVYEGIEDALIDLVEIADLYVATSKPKFFSEKILKHFSLDKYFLAIYGSELDGTRTDKGQLIAFLLAEEGIDPKTVLMIGDREHDMIGAERNRVTGVGAGWGFGSEKELINARARIVLRTPSEIFKYVQNYVN